MYFVGLLFCTVDNDRFVEIRFSIAILSLLPLLDPCPKSDESAPAPETKENEDEKEPQVEKPAHSGSNEEVAGVIDWCRPSGIAFGAATSLYERNPTTGETAGNPLADVITSFSVTYQIDSVKEKSPFSFRRLRLWPGPTTLYFV